MFVDTSKDFPFTKTYENNTTGYIKVQENYYPSLNKGNGKMLCGTCLGEIEYSFSRTRSMKYTSEDGPVAQPITVAVGYCLEDGRFFTIYPDTIIRYKQYGISDVRSVLENKEDFSLASSRTRAYWRSWFKGVWDAVIKHIQLCIHNILSKSEISIALYAYYKECGDEWLRYILDLFSTELNNLCMFFTIISTTIDFKSKKLHYLHIHDGADRQKPPRGG